MGESKIEKVKLKLSRSPTIASSPNYEKSYTPWTEHTAEGYCKFRVILDQYVKQDLLNNVNEQVNSV
jgi:hypothetical protein